MVAFWRRHRPRRAAFLRVICGVLGCPASDRLFFRRCLACSAPASVPPQHSSENNLHCRERFSAGEGISLWKPGRRLRLSRWAQQAARKSNTTIRTGVGVMIAKASEFFLSPGWGRCVAGPRSRCRLVLIGLLPVLGLGGVATSLPAQSIFEPFNYSPGVNLIGQSPMPPLVWEAAGPAGLQQARVQAGALSWPGLSNCAPNRIILRAGNGPSSLFVFGTLDPADAYPVITTDTICFSFVLRVTDLTGLAAAGAYFAGFAPDQSGGGVTPANVFTRVLLRPSGAGYNIGLVKSSSVVAEFTWDATVFNPGDT